MSKELEFLFEVSAVTNLMEMEFVKREALIQKMKEKGINAEDFITVIELLEDKVDLTDDEINEFMLDRALDTIVRLVEFAKGYQEMGEINVSISEGHSDEMGNVDEMDSTQTTNND